MTNLIAAIVLITVLGLATLYIVRAKKNGKKCIGCPCSCGNAESGTCSGNCQTCYDFEAG